MNEVTQGELVRRIETLERREVNFVLKELHERDVRTMKDDIAEIKSSQQWATRLIVGQFILLLVALIMLAITGGIQLGN